MLNIYFSMENIRLKKSDLYIAFTIIATTIVMLLNSAVRENILILCREELIAFCKDEGDIRNFLAAEIIPLSYVEYSQSPMQEEALPDGNSISAFATSTDAEAGEQENEADKKDSSGEASGIDRLTGDTDVTEELAPATIINDAVPICYERSQLTDFDFLVSNCYLVDKSTYVKPEELNADTLLDMDMRISDGDGYKVLIYHTHGSEAFSDSRKGVTEDTVIGVGDELTRILEEKYGIKTYHDRNVYDVVDSVLDRSYAYTLSGAAVDRILAENPSIEVVIDLHRDGVSEDVRLVRVINDKQVAQIMFLNGVSRLSLNGDIDYLYNPNKIANLAFSLQMHLAGKEMYGDLMRKIYIRGYSFNLEKLPKASLVEVGAQTNTVEEAKNAMEPLAAILNRVLKGE